MEGLEEAHGAGVGGPAFEDDAVAQHALFAVLPWVGDGFDVVGVAVDVADFTFADGVWGGDSGHEGEHGAGA